MNAVLRGVRIIDPIAGLDAWPRDVWLRDGRIAAIDTRIDPPPGTAIVDLSVPAATTPLVVSPAFIDLHAHLREPGEESKEMVRSGAAAAAAGGFGQIVAMANTSPPADTPERVREAIERARGTAVRVHTVAALSRGLRGEEITDVPACLAAGAVAISDDGRNAAGPPLLCRALELAGRAGRPVLVHPEDETMVLAANPGTHAADVTRCPDRPAAAERAAVQAALTALARARGGRLHLQHLTTAAGVDALREARRLGLEVTAEVTPHHLGLCHPLDPEPEPASLAKVNPPLRSEADREALIGALCEGVIDAVATDHAPHGTADKALGYALAAAGMTGLETALATCIALAGMGGDLLPVLVERLTAGPWRVLGARDDLIEPRLRVGEPATLVLLDAEAAWTVGGTPSASLSRNTALVGAELRGRVELTIVGGEVAHIATGSPAAAALREVGGLG